MASQFDQPKIAEAHATTALEDRNSYLNPKPSSMSQGQGHANSITMVIYGVNAPKQTMVANLTKTIEEQLMNMTIDKIGNYFIRTSGLMSIQDYHYIEQTDRKYQLLFPI